MTITLPMEIITLIASGLLTILGFLFKSHSSRINSIETTVESVKLEIANDFLKKTEYERLEKAMLTKLDRIETKQDNLFFELAKKQDR